jgi:hypothetical protein
MPFLRWLVSLPGSIWRAMLRAAPMRRWWQAGAAMSMTMFAAGLVLILWLGPWTLAVEAKRVDGIVIICLAVLFIVLVSIVAMNDMNLSLKASRNGLDANISPDDPVIVEKEFRTSEVTEEVRTREVLHDRPV